MDGWIGTDPFQPGPISHHGQIVFRTGVMICVLSQCDVVFMTTSHQLSEKKTKNLYFEFQKTWITPTFYGHRLTQSQNQTL